MNPPKWAQELIIEAMIYLESKGIKGDLPTLKWRHGSGFYSSGHATNRKSIVITAGKHRLDQKLVVLHELSHIVAKPIEQHSTVAQAKKRGWITDSRLKDTDVFSTRHVCHSENFWDIAWDLYRWAKLPIRYCKTREGNYRKGSIAAYHRNVKTSK
jgi:hypothetical protein